MKMSSYKRSLWAIFGCAFISFLVVYRGATPVLEVNAVSLPFPVDDSSSREVQKRLEITTDTLFTQTNAIDSITNVKLEHPEVETLYAACEKSFHSTSLKSDHFINITEVLPFQTAEECRSRCAESGFPFAVLLHGVCYCNYLPPPKRVVFPMSYCDEVKCTEDNPTICLQLNSSMAITMRSLSQDGWKSWTAWMSLDVLGVKSRYRNCERPDDAIVQCEASVEKLKTRNTSSSLKTVADHYIGCFTGASIRASKQIVDKRTFMTKSQSYEYCHDWCTEKGSDYAVASSNKMSQSKTRDCLCINTLELSQPVTSCSDGFGYVVLATKNQSQSVNTVLLKFGASIQSNKVKVLIIARYRSGSSMTQSLFTKYPGALTLFEPDKDIRESTAALQMLEAVYSCDMNKLHHIFYNSDWVKWSNRMLNIRAGENNPYASVQRCASSRPKHVCLPYFKEECDRAKLINIKEIRVLEVEPVKQFALNHPEIQVVHLVRDPRGILASQNSFGGGIQTPEELCLTMRQMAEMVYALRDDGVTNIHQVYYEEIAMNASRAGHALYNEMDLVVPEAVRHFLSREEYTNSSTNSSGAAVPKAAQEVVVKDPKSHVYRFLNRNSIKVIEKVDSYCQPVYEYWKDRYLDWNTIKKTKLSEVAQYLSKSNLATLKDQGLLND